MEQFNFNKLKLPNRIYHVAKFLEMEMDLYNLITAKRPIDVNPESIALAAIAYLSVHDLTKYILLEKVVADALILLPAIRKGFNKNDNFDKEGFEEFERTVLPEIAQLHIAKARKMYEQKSAIWDMEVEEHIKNIEWIAQICTGEIECDIFPVTRFYLETDRIFDIDSFTNRTDLYECMMRGRYGTKEEYWSDREDTLVLLGIPETDAKQILDILVPHVFPHEFA